MNKCPKCEGELYLCGADHADFLESESTDRYHCPNNQYHNFTIEQLLNAEEFAANHPGEVE